MSVLLCCDCGQNISLKISTNYRWQNNYYERASNSILYSESIVFENKTSGAYRTLCVLNNKTKSYSDWYDDSTTHAG